MRVQSIHQIKLVVFFVLLGGLIVLPASAAGKSNTSRYIVVFNDSVSAPGNLARKQTENRDAKLGFVYRHALEGYSAVLTEKQVEGLEGDSRVDYVSPDHRVESFAQSIPTGIDRIFASDNDALDIDEADDQRVDVDVAVIDTGTTYVHADLDVVARVNCSDGTEEEAQCSDGNDYGSEHGTHVAGTIGALDNGFGVLGVAPGARIWSVGVLDVHPNWESEVAAGVDWVTARADEIEVANMSLGCECQMTVLAEMITESVDAGVVYAVAAGNDGSGVINYSPANHPDVITVSAMADFDGKPGGKAGSSSCRTIYQAWSAGNGFGSFVKDDAKAGFSNYGEAIDIAAPGVCIRSTVFEHGYDEFFWGTSMAAPHVAGAAALLASQDDPENREDVEAIRETILEQGNFEWEDTAGDGVPLLDVSNEVVFAPVLTQPPYAFSFATGGAGPSQGEFETPRGIAIDAEDNAWVADTHNSRVQKLDPEGDVAGALGGDVIASGPGDSANDERQEITVKATGGGFRLNMVHPFDPGSVPTGETAELPYNASASAVDAALEGLSTIGGLGGSVTVTGGPGNEAGSNPYVVTFKGTLGGDDLFALTPTNKLTGGEKKISVTTANNGGATEICDSAAGDLCKKGIVGEANGQFRLPTEVVIDPEGNIWVAEDWPNIRIQKFSAEGAYLDQITGLSVGCPTNNDQFDIAADPEGGIWVVEVCYHRVRKFSAGGEYLDEFPLEASETPGGFKPPRHIAVDANGGIWVNDRLEHHIQKFSPEGELLDQFGSRGYVDGELYGPSGMDFDAEGNLWVIDFLGRVQEFSPEGDFMAKFNAVGADSVPVVDGPEDLAVDSEGDIWVADSDSDRMQKWGPSTPDPAPKPVVATEPATEIEDTQATLRASVNPRGSATNYQFEYGKTTSYGSKVPASPKAIGSGSSAVAVGEWLGGLQAGTTYHFRVVASNANGTVYGKDRAFTTEFSGADNVAVWYQGWSGFYLRKWDEENPIHTYAQYGNAGSPALDLPVMGDWNGDGIDTLGVWRREGEGASYRLRNSNTEGEPDIITSWGRDESPELDFPVVGDWDGDGDDTVGVWRRQGEWATFHLRNNNVSGPADLYVYWGGDEAPYLDIPVVGDWDGDGIDTVGVWRRSNDTFYLRNSHAEKCEGSCITAVQFGNSAAPYNDLPVVGDWDGDGDDTIGVWRREGPWAHFRLRNSNTAGSPDHIVYWGGSESGYAKDWPLVGNWGPS